ncbi:MAG: hypothetical protein CVU06_02740 [Bacteroidetes bacterium HGW-Bacteroidetes-22]|nr:MAG: hypothetical protein CVU06_02740 [Bacteroidetes bacterium HGW-Bacteroidetes-22]
MKKLLTTFLLLLYLIPAKSNRPGFVLDGYFDDWVGCKSVYRDAAHDSEGIDFISMCVRNDADWLYIKLEFAEPTILNLNNDIYLEIDTDNDEKTGYRVAGIGAEMGWNFGSRYGYYNLTENAKTLNHNNIDLYSLPTYASREFELAINRKVLPDGINPLFTYDTIRIVLWDRRTGGDLMPDAGKTFSYVINDDFTNDFTPISIAKENPGSIRIMTWNTFVNGLIDPVRAPVYERIFNVLQPDIVTLNECWSVTAEQTAELLNQWLPVNNKHGWYTTKTDEGNITCSRFPILQSNNIMEDHRMSAVLIEQPLSPVGKMMVINCHLTCCQSDDIRQNEVDALIQFLRQSFTGQNDLKLDPTTPFYLAGDLNLVGDVKQLNTLLTGDISDNETYGPDYPPDGGNTSLLDLVSTLTDRAMAYTWRDPDKTFSPSRLDYILYTGQRITILKSFNLQTEIMPDNRLDEVHLFKNDTKAASDHLPRIADISFL